jgi:type IV pilus assembly protein PilO
MPLLPTKQRDQILLMVIVLSLGAIGGYYMYVYQDKAEQISTLESHVATLDSLNNKVKAEIRRGSVERLKQEAELYSADLQLLRHLVPNTHEVPSLLEQISTAARRAGLELQDVAPQGVQPGDQFDTYRYKIATTGGYHQIAEFLTNVGAMERIVAPMNLALMKAARSGEKQPKPHESLLDAKLDIQTYVAHAATATPGSGAPGAAPASGQGNP